MATLGDQHAFVVPKREIFAPEDMEKWTTSDAYQEIVGFIEAMNEAVRGKPISTPVKASPVIQSIVEMLEKIDGLVDETPTHDDLNRRFGDKGFADFYGKLVKEAPKLLGEALPEKYQKAVPELVAYLTESVGNKTRIDYGTGHELAFVMLMYCLFRVGALDCNSKDDKIAAVNVVFNQYMTLVRKIQTKYTMEPAGSHGVWSLDDFQFIPFIWGSSQLIGNSRMEPSQFTEEEAIESLHTEFMFLGCIKYIFQVKSGPFHEHSNQLWNISGTSGWTKINQGLIKMYKGEVLAKHPVVQHMLFGSILSIKPFDKTKKAPASARLLSSLGGIRHPSTAPPPPPVFKPDETS